MKIIVPIKQVPDVRAVRMDEATGTVIREGVEAIVNPLDLYAIELAFRLKRDYGAKVTAISMGPAKADAALREAVAMGLDDAILLSDRAFAGSDTWATSYVLAGAIRKLGGCDLVVCGERAVDGDTGQVGPGIAAFLDLPVAAYVSGFDRIEGEYAYLSRLLETGYEQIKMKLPAVLTVVKEAAEPGLPTLSGKKRSRGIEVPVWGLADLGLDAEKVGLKGSPTRVVKIEKPKLARSCRMIQATELSQIPVAVKEFCSFAAE